MPAPRPLCVRRPVAPRSFSATRGPLEPVANPLEQQSGAIAFLGEKAQSPENEDPALEDRYEAANHPDDDQQRANR